MSNFVFADGFYHYAPVNDVKVTLDGKVVYRFMSNVPIVADNFTIINKIKSKLTTGFEYVLGFGDNRICLHTY